MELAQSEDINKTSQSLIELNQLPVLDVHKISNYIPDIILTDLQQKAYDKYREGENIFITGPGGSGKSALIKTIVKDAIHRNIKIQVCGLTGCATVLLDGCKAKTLHSWAGIGLATGDIEIISHRVSTNKYKRRGWLNCDILIIDEVSMMSEKLIELLDITAKKCKKNNKPFGGIQVIFSGDFFQLPPVGDEYDPKTTNFCFQSPIFYILFPRDNQIYFNKIFRQKDPVYSKILNQIRVGKISSNTIKLLSSYVNKPIPKDIDIKPTIILPKRRMVETINNNSLKNIESEPHSFRLQHKKMPANETQEKSLGKISDTKIQNEFKFLQSNINAEIDLTLKVGAQVMCVVNFSMDDESNVICNGSQGIITEFHDTGYPIVKFYNGTTKIITPHLWKSEQYPGLFVQQIPLILSWAITIHKAQGMSIELAEIDIGNNIFAAGQTYVALSRVVSLEGLYLRNFDYTKIRVNKKVKKFYQELL